MQPVQGHIDERIGASRTVAGLLLAGALLLLVIVLVSLRFAALTQKNSADALAAAQTNNRAAMLLNLLQDAETSQRGYILTSDTKYLAPYKRSEVLIRLQFFDLTGAMVEAGVDSVTVNRLKVLIDNKVEELRRTIDLVAAGNVRDAVEVVRTDKGKLVMDEIRQIMALITRITNDASSTRNAALDAASRWLMISIAGGAMLLVMLVGGAVFLVAARARQLEAARKALAGHNELLETRVRERTRFLQRANKELQSYSYIVGHDLRAPLVNIMGFTAELERASGIFKDYIDTPVDMRDALSEKTTREAVDEDVPEALRFIRSSMKRMDELINEILRLARAGSRQLAADPVDVGDVVREAVSTVRHRLEEGNADVLIAPDLPSAITDRLALQQIFGNLLDNAIKYADPARPVSIRISGREAGGMIEIDVADNGRGIAAQDYERIFELFRRSGPQDRPGEGIGLAHVRASARRLGGDVTVRSVLGTGTTFEVRFASDFRQMNEKETA